MGLTAGITVADALVAGRNTLARLRYERKIPDDERANVRTIELVLEQALADVVGTAEARDRLNAAWTSNDEDRNDKGDKTT